METLYLLIPVSVVLVFFVGLAFWWSLRSGQFDDLDGPAYRVLMDDDRNGEQATGTPSPDTPEATAVPPAGATPRAAAAPSEGPR